MRSDIEGFFWNDVPPPPPPKAEKPKRIPPKKTWLSPDYLPGLEEARTFPVHVMNILELTTAANAGETLIVDTEIYRNYFLAMFTSIETGYVFFLESWDGGPKLDCNLLGWILTSFQTVGFNSLNFDIPICTLAIAGKTLSQIKDVADSIIIEEVRAWDILKNQKVKKLIVNHIDLIEVAPLFGSLKTYGARLHVRKLQDLPFPPNTILSEDQITITRWYCVNDTVLTAYLYVHLKEHIDLRINLGLKYKLDLRSHSDAQMAEEIISYEIKRITGHRPRRPTRGQSVGQVFRYKPPSYIYFQTTELQQALWEMSNADITVGPSGHAECPKVIRERIVVIAGKPYKVGMGGLHSQEKAQALISNSIVRYFDRDVTGYYPNLILKNRFAPPHLGDIFLTALQGMVDRRTQAKRFMQDMDNAGTNKELKEYKDATTEASGLKIANNGIFGKTSDPFSVVYDVPNMVQVTLTGQLSLLMAIEALELAKIPVMSANTDGIVIGCPVDRVDDMRNLFTAWEIHTNLETEETEYKSLYAANVNNYIAITPKGKTKTKGWYCERGSAHNSVLSKNPEVLICSDAVQDFLSKGKPITETIRSCKDIRRFVAVRVVNGGGVKVWDDNHTEYLGKTVRWYYAKDVPGEIVYAKSGNKVPRTDGAKPLMELTLQIPEDLDYEWYEAKAYQILEDIGAVAPAPEPAK